MNRVMKNKRISAIDITDSGDEVLIASYYVNESGKTVSEITALPTATSDSRLIFTVEDAAIYECRYLDNGGFVLICSDALRFYSSDGKQTDVISYTESGVTRYVSDREGVLLVGTDKSDPTKSKLSFYGSDGGFKGEISVDADFADVTKDKDSALVLYDDRLSRVGLGFCEQYSVKESLPPLKVIAGSNSVFVCTEGVAYISQKEKEGES